jgi:DNA polymerase-3 subunit delta'
VSVEEMRRFLSHFSTSSFLGGTKIGVVTGAHDLSIEAANALLKTLEEPRGNALLILLASDTARVPATVMSRCQTLRFLPVPCAELEAGLVRRSVPDAGPLARLSAGRPGIAIALSADAEARFAHEETVRGFLSFTATPISSRLTAVGGLVKDETLSAITGVLDTWSGALRDMICVKTGNDARVVNAFAAPLLASRAAAYRLTELARIAALVRDARRLLLGNINPRLALEHVALNF